LEREREAGWEDKERGEDERGREANGAEDRERYLERETERERDREAGWESNHTLKADHCQPEEEETCIITVPSRERERRPGRERRRVPPPPTQPTPSSVF
jgi:hypothetical protein